MHTGLDSHGMVPGLLTRRTFALAGLAVAGVVLAACDSGPDGEELRAEALRKGRGTRVVALSRSVGELWLLSGGTLVGIAEDGLDLDGIGDAVSIGTSAEPSLERVIALEPDLVMVDGDLSAQVELCESLRSGGIATFVVDIASFDDYAATMLDLATVTGRTDLYGKNVTNIATRIGWLREKAREKAPALAQTTYLALRVSATENEVLKSDNFACAIFDDIGLSNIAAGTSRFDDLSVEDIVSTDPGYVLIFPQGGQEEALAAYQESFASKPAWAKLTASKLGRVFVLPRDLFQRKPNAKWAEAYQYACRLIYP